METISKTIFKSKKIRTIEQNELADRITPVEAFIRLRDFAPDPIMLESSDYRSKDQSRSFIGIDPVAEIKLQNGIIETRCNGELQKLKLAGLDKSLDEVFSEFLNSFEFDKDGDDNLKMNGIFGFTTFDSIAHFDGIQIKKAGPDVPTMLYRVYRYILVFDHFDYKLKYIENLFEGEESSLPNLVKQLNKTGAYAFDFSADEGRTSNMEDETFLDLVKKGKQHCKRGDVFQMVVSRSFQRNYTGDEFNLYRALRSVNPSPYLFYFDYGSFKLLGSSPESHLVIDNNLAQIFPIAGTYRRTGNDKRDLELANELLNDPKENAEHIMLVDLARNDLNRIAKDVRLDFYKETQFFSHVIHLCSKVVGEINPKINSFKAIASTFPAGTLSGAPKHRALQLISEYEPTRRGIYGGAIGLINFKKEVNHAIIIRSFLCKDKKLNYQAGAGVVIDSSPEKELQEVENKVAALEKAISITQKIKIS